ncbi:P-loop containing nucleoside triphosphate hydrolase protein [Trametes elegans]|nr:P-loop containing nucleoside triphosphate hydrolase protein [Trametes elegans]
MDDNHKATRAPADDARLERIQLGVWTLTISKKKADGTRAQSSEVILSFVRLMRRICADVYRIDPWALIIPLLSNALTSLEPMLLLYCSASLLQQIEKALVSGKADMTAITLAVVVRLVCVALISALRWWKQNTMPRLERHVIRQLKANLVAARLRTDMPTSLKPATTDKVKAREVWDSLALLFELCGVVVNSISLLALIATSSRSIAGRGPIFLALCVAKPLISQSVIGERSIWPIPHIVHTDNEVFLRLKRLVKMSKPKFHEEVIGAGLGDYILDEYKKASALLRHTSDEYVSMQYRRRASPVAAASKQLLGELPLLYCVLYAVRGSGTLSVASVAVLQQSSQTFGEAIGSLLFCVEQFKDFSHHINRYYRAIEAPDKQNELADGKLTYPLPQSSSKGMGFELRNVCFEYPGNTEQGALKGVSLTIKPGQLVVIVGANGSGKSTLIKLLTRLFDPTSGTISVDGEPMPAYRQNALREATALLSQAHQLFPLSIRENIALGCVALPRGLDTALDPNLSRAYGNLVPDDGGDPLRQRLEALERPIEVSGGEAQRLVAARTFMRFNSGKVRGVLVDEPSSALDPEGERALFENLRKAREGKTMIFVTHRFGHLTEHADLIVCMKGGLVAEQGSHKELVALDGEYKKLYDLQASAFL